MKSTSVTVRENSSTRVELGNLIISARTTYGTHSEVVIGRPGMPNVEKDMRTGDCVLYETIDEGTLEIRAMSMNTSQVTLLVTEIAPTIGLLAGAVDDDPNNSPFTESELLRIGSSLEDLKARLLQNPSIRPEQFELISRKLEDIQKASERLGRKDWIQYVAGSLTSLCISAAFAPDVTRQVFAAANAAFTWLFTTGVLLLP